jgi:hypothetical protein
MFSFVRTASLRAEVFSKATADDTIEIQLMTKHKDSALIRKDHSSLELLQFMDLTKI